MIVGCEFVALMAPTVTIMAQPLSPVPLLGYIDASEDYVINL